MTQTHRHHWPTIRINLTMSDIAITRSSSVSRKSIRSTFWTVLALTRLRLAASLSPTGTVAIKSLRRSTKQTVQRWLHRASATTRVMSTRTVWDNITFRQRKTNYPAGTIRPAPTTMRNNPIFSNISIHITKGVTRQPSQRQKSRWSKICEIWYIWRAGRFDDSNFSSYLCAWHNQRHNKQDRDKHRRQFSQSSVTIILSSLVCFCRDYKVRFAKSKFPNSHQKEMLDCGHSETRVTFNRPEFTFRIETNFGWAFWLEKNIQLNHILIAWRPNMARTSSFSPAM